MKKLTIFALSLICCFGITACNASTDEVKTPEIPVAESAVDMAPNVRTVSEELPEDHITEMSSREINGYALMVTGVDSDFYGLYCNALQAMGFTDIVLSGAMGFKAYDASGTYGVVCGFGGSTLLCSIGLAEVIDEEYPTEDIMG